MASTNQTSVLKLPLFVGTDKPSWLGDWNSAMTAIDTAIGTAKGDIASASNAATAAQAKAEEVEASVTNISNVQTTQAQEIQELQTQATGFQDSISQQSTTNTQVNAQLQTINQTLISLQNQINNGIGNISILSRSFDSALAGSDDAFGFSFIINGDSRFISAHIAYDFELISYNATANIDGAKNKLYAIAQGSKGWFKDVEEVNSRLRAFPCYFNNGGNRAQLRGYFVFAYSKSANKTTVYLAFPLSANPTYVSGMVLTGPTNGYGVSNFMEV